MAMRMRVLILAEAVAWHLTTDNTRPNNGDADAGGMLPPRA